MSTSDLARKLVDYLRPFLDLRCVGGRLYLGSMFYLDFGDLFISSTSKGERIQVGEMTLSVRDVAWWLRNGSELVASSESIDTRQFEALIAQLVGSRLLGVSDTLTGEQLEIHFENERVLVIDLLNTWDTDSDTVQVSLPDGRVIAVTETGVLDENSGFDGERARNWAASPRRH